MMFETAESYHYNKENDRRKAELNCNLHAQKIGEFERELKEVAVSMKDISSSMKSIATGISNTVDSHRTEMNELNIRVGDIEKLAEGMDAQRTVILSVAATVVSLVVISLYMLMSTKVQLQKRIDFIETKIGVKP